MVVLITGASAGFGREASKIFIQNGHKVIGFARREEKLNALKEELGASFIPVALDIRDRDGLKKALEELPNEFKNIDVLVNNAGLALGLDTAESADFSDWNTMIETNITALTSITHLVLPEMVKRGEGYIINIGSIAGSYAYPGSSVYGASKAFVRQFSLNLRADLIGKNIRVTNVEPGLCDKTEFSDVRFKGDGKRARGIYENVEALTAKDIGNTIYWLATQPKHINVNIIELMPVAQSFAGLKTYRKE